MIDTHAFEWQKPVARLSVNASRCIELRARILKVEDEYDTSLLQPSTHVYPLNRSAGPRRRRIRQWDLPVLAAIQLLLLLLALTAPLPLLLLLLALRLWLLP